MQKNKKKQKAGDIYIRYLLSFTVVLLIPLLILTFFYSSRFMKKFYEEIYETVDLELVQIGTQLENELEQMQNIVGQFTLTGTVQNIVSAKNPLQLNQTISYLSGLSSANSFIEDIVLIPYGQEYVVTSTTTSKTNYYFSRIFQSTADETTAFLDKIQNSPAPLCMPYQCILNLNYSSPKEAVVLFSYPLYTDYQKRQGTALFYVKSKSIQALLSQKLASYNAQIYIKNNDGTVIALSESNEQKDPKIQAFLNDTSTNATVFDGNNYLLRSYTPSKSTWSYYAFIPNKQTTFSQVNDIMNEFIIAIIVILLLAGFAILFLQKVNYAPMKRLRDKATQISPDITSSNEFATISHALDYLSLQNDSLSLKLADNFTAIKNDRLYRLVSGNYMSKDDFNLDCGELDLYLAHDYFIANIIMLHSPVKNINDLAQEIKKSLQMPHVYYYLHNFYSDQIILLFNLPAKSSVPTEQIYAAQMYLQKKHNLLSTIGIGSIVENTDRIPQSYMEAVSALDYRFVKGNGTIIEFKEALGSKNAKTVYPYREFETLKNALLTKNENNIYDAIQNIIHFMESSQLPLYLARSICFDLIHLVNEHCHNQKSAADSSPIKISGVETAQEIIESLRVWSENLNNLSGAAAKKAAIEDVIQFVNNNCLNCEFSAFETAEYFEMTLPAFSKFFKDQTGQNVMDYTIQMRIAKAKKLLQETDLPLTEISVMVGYYNISSFTRRFKLNQGVAPSEYRKISLDK